jgi:hypothetical protein
MTHPLFNTVAFLHNEFNTPPGLVAFLRAYTNDPPNLPAVEKWWQRGNIPSQWMAFILALLELDRGEPVRLACYLGEY